MELYQMPVHIRNFLIKEFSNLKEEENKQLEKITAKNR